MVARYLFETGSDVEHRLSKEIKKLKNNLKTQIEKFDNVNKQLTRLSEKRKSSENLLANISQEVQRLKRSGRILKGSKKRTGSLRLL